MYFQGLQSSVARPWRKARSANNRKTIHRKTHDKVCNKGRTSSHRSSDLNINTINHDKLNDNLRGTVAAGLRTTDVDVKDAIINREPLTPCVFCIACLAWLTSAIPTWRLHTNTIFIPTLVRDNINIRTKVAHTAHQ